MGWQDDAVVTPPAPVAAPAAAGGGHWTDDPVSTDTHPQAPRMSFAQMKAAHPEEYDPSSPEYKAKYGARGPNVGPLAVAAGTGEAALNLGSSAVATPLAGLAGAAQGVKNFVTGSGTPAADRVAQVQQALTYQPRTEAGQNLQKAVSYPFEKLAQGADKAGQVVSDVTGSPAAGAAVNTAVQFLPALLLRGRGGAGAAAGESTGAGAGAASAEAAAKAYVARRTSLDWNSLSDQVKARLTDIAKAAGNLDTLDPAALERQARAESLSVPVKGTRAQLTRNRADLANEGTLAATTSGSELAAIRDAQSPAIVQNLEVLKGKVQGSAPASGELQVGQSVQGSLRQKAAASKANYDALYEKARATEPDAQVSSAPLFDLLDKNPAVQHLGFMDGWLKKAGLENTETTGGIEVKTQKPVKLSELADLREEASGIASTGGTDGFYAAKVVRAIDQARANVPAAAKAWKAADQAFAKHRTEFGDQGAVEQLVENRTKTDRTVALEDTWDKTVKGGSLEDLNAVKRSLLTGPDAAARTAGRQAWRDLRAQTIQHFIDESTKSSAPLANGSTPVSAAGMERAINSIGPDKLNSLFGPGTAAMLDRILQVTKDMRTEPARIHPGASTMGNLVAFLERNLNRVPVLGDTAAGVVRGTVKLRELGASGRQVREAKVTPLDEASQASQNSLAKQARQNALSRAAPYASTTQGRN